MHKLKLGTFSLTVILTTVSAIADTVTVARPGLSCVLPEALGKLTRPDGSSLADGPSASSQAKQLALQGGCMPLRIGQTMTAISIRKNTSIVTVDAGDGQGPRTFYLPNIDVSVHRDSQSVAVAAAGSALAGQAAALPATSGESSDAIRAPTQPAVTAAPLGPPAQTGISTASTPSSVTPGRTDLSIQGVRLGESYEQSRSVLHQHWFIKHVPLSDPAFRLMVAGKTDHKESVSVETLNGKVILIEHTLSYGGDGPPRPAEPDLARQMIGRYGQPNELPPDLRTGWLFRYTYGAGGARQPDKGFACEQVSVQPFEVRKTAGDEPELLSGYVLGSANPGCHITLRLFSSAIGGQTTAANELLETLFEDDSLLAHLSHRDAPSMNAGAAEGSPLPADGDEPAADDQPIDRPYAVGGITLGEGAAQVKARMASSFTVHDGHPGIDGETLFSLDGNDKHERFIIQTVGDRIIAITHDQQFQPGGEPLVTTVLDLAKTKFGPQDDAVPERISTGITWSIGRDGRETPKGEGCGYRLQNVSIDGSGGDGPPLSAYPPFALDARLGCRYAFQIEGNKDQSDPNLMISLRTIMVDVAHLREFEIGYAKAAADALARREKAAAANKTSL